MSLNITKGNINVTVSGGAGVSTPHVVIVGWMCSDWVRLTNFMGHAQNASDADQMYFQLRHNGALIPHAQAMLFWFSNRQKIDLIIPPGMLEVVCTNLSGTGLPGAATTAYDILVSAAWEGIMGPEVPHDAW